MQKSIGSFLAGMLTATILGTTVVPSLAAVLTSRATIEVDPINIQVNGETFKPKDANGNPVSVFAYNGTTYAPLRALAEAYGLDVWYDQEKNRASVGRRGSKEYEISPQAIKTDDKYEEFKALWVETNVIEYDHETSEDLKPGETAVDHFMSLVDDTISENDIINKFGNEQIFKYTVKMLIELRQDETRTGIFFLGVKSDMIQPLLGVDERYLKSLIESFDREDQYSLK